MTTCRAAVFVGPQKPLEIQEFAVPELEPGAVLVKMAMAAVCGSDVHAWHNPNSLYPIIWGHENVGVVAKLGKGIGTDVLGRPLKDGDRVLFYPVPCGKCDSCLIE